VSALTRRQALAAAAAAGVTAAALPLPAAAQEDEEELWRDALDAVLRLEQTALVAYEAIANSGILTNTLRGFLDQERQHADQLEATLETLGAEPPIPPRRADIARLDSALRSRGGAARFAIALELRTVAAYQEAIEHARDPNVIRTSAGAMGTDAQQLVVLREIAGEAPVPRAFETGRR
jgi:rubrerythrin